MGSIQTWLEQHPDDATADPGSILKSMQAAGPPVIDSTLRTYGSLARLFGADAVGKIDETLIRIPGMGWISKTLSSIGLDFSAPETQAGLDKLIAGGAFTPQIGGALKLLGVRPQTAWVALFGDEPLPEETEIVAAQNESAATPALVYDQRLVLLSVNIGTTAALSYRVQSAAKYEGQLKAGETLAVIATGDAENATLGDAERALVDAILLAVRTHAGSI